MTMTRRERIEQLGMFDPTTDPWGELKDLWNVIDEVTICEGECEADGEDHYLCEAVRAYHKNQDVNQVDVIIGQHFVPLGLFGIFSGEREHTIESVFGSINAVLSAKLNGGQYMSIEELADMLDIDKDEIQLVITRAKEAHESWWANLAQKLSDLLDSVA